MNRRISRLLLGSSFALIILCFLISTPQNLLNSMQSIISHKDMLIVDYFEVGGMAGGILNASLLIFFSTLLMNITKAPFNGLNVASIMLMGSFGLFGKNIFNVVPIIMGTYLYSLASKTPFKDTVAIALFASCFAPFVTELVFYTQIPLVIALVLAMSVGFLIVPVSRHLYNVHEGFNLYNIGFGIGILSTLYVSVMKSYSYAPQTQLILKTMDTPKVFIMLLVFFILMFALGIYYDKQALIKMKNLLKESGYKDNDFLQKYGLGTTLVNMSINGVLSLIYVVIFAKAPLNGPSIGGIFTVVGFSGLGKHARNIIPIFLGVYLGSLTHFWNIYDTSIIFAALFGTALAPIAGHFGFFYGVIASMINASVVLSSGSLHAGLNLYNTGFSVGIVSGVLVPLFKIVKPSVERLRLKLFPNN